MRPAIPHVLEPFLLERRLLPKIWGGRALERDLGIPLPAGDEPVGESWELYDRTDGASRVRGSDHTLADLMREHAEALVGRGVPLGHEGQFPLLLKFLDAHDGLSLQVHPDDAQAVGDMGKNECCLILRTDDNARIVHGVRDGVTREEFLDKWQTPEVEELLYSFRPQVGDLVHIPPGTPHGIGPGVVAFEIQENSDLTYRFYDWGRGRATNPDRARDVFRMVTHERRPVERSTSLSDGGELLLATPHFVVRRYQVGHDVALSTDARYLTITALDGACRVTWSGGALEMGRCDTALVPACIEGVEVAPQSVDGQAPFVDLVACSPGAR